MEYAKNKYRVQPVHAQVDLRFCYAQKYYCSLRNAQNKAPAMRHGPGR